MSFFVSYRIGKLAAPQPIKGLSFINSNALSQIENLAFEVKTSRFSNIENLASTSEGIILIANSLKLKGKIFVTAAINKVINKIKKRNNKSLEKINLTIHFEKMSNKLKKLLKY